LINPSPDVEVRRTDIEDRRGASGDAAAPPANVINLRRRPWSNIGLAPRLGAAGQFAAGSGYRRAAEKSLGRPEMF
jgi:hypothetical protein